MKWSNFDKLPTDFDDLDACTLCQFIGRGSLPSGISQNRAVKSDFPSLVGVNRFHDSARGIKSIIRLTTVRNSWLTLEPFEKCCDNEDRKNNPDQKLIGKPHRYEKRDKPHYDTGNTQSEGDEGTRCHFADDQHETQDDPVPPYNRII